MNRSIVFVPAVLLAAAVAAAAQPECSIHPPKGASKAELAHLAKVSRADAERTAKSTFRDPAAVAVAEAELETERGCLIWSFDFTVDGRSGVDEVAVDAGDGKVLSHTHETPGAEAAEKHGSGAEPRR